ELERRLAEETASLERRLLETTTAADAARQRAAQDRIAAADEHTLRQRELQGVLDAERSKRAGLEAALAEAGRARDEAQTRHSSAMVEVAAQVRDLEAALRASRHEHESSAADAAR